MFFNVKYAFGCKLSKYQQTINLINNSVAEAHSLIKKYVHPTPILKSSYFSNKYQKDIYLKLENLNITGSFKIRGAAHSILSRLKSGNKLTDIVATSAGNHAQGLAYIAQKLGINCTIFMPLGTPIIKIQSTQNYNAKVILSGTSYAETEKNCMEWNKRHKAHMIHAFKDIDVIKGQATVAYEILNQLDDIDYVICPVGGGGLISGVSSVFKQVSKNTKIVGVQSELCCSVARCFKDKNTQKHTTDKVEDDRIICQKKHCDLSTKILKASSILADGIAVKKPSDMCKEIIKNNVDKMVCVSEQEIAGAIMQLLERDHVLAEGAAASVIAALDRLHLNQAITDSNIKSKIVCIISGGNIDATILNRITQKGLSQSSRMIKFVLKLEDNPGSLAKCLRIISNNKANLYNINHNRIFSRHGIKEAEVEFELEIANKEHADKLYDDLIKNGYLINFKKN